MVRAVRYIVCSHTHEPHATLIFTIDTSYTSPSFFYLSKQQCNLIMDIDCLVSLKMAYSSSLVSLGVKGLDGMLFFEKPR